jgi:predicted dehydrogenase
MGMDKKLRVAILGGGGILGAHAPGFNRLPDLCEVVAVAEPNEARHGVIRELLQKDVPIYGDYNEVLALPALDAVDILLPHNLHMDAGVKAAERGLHVLVEKVMARNVYECRTMIDACEKAGVLLVVGHDRRYAGDWVALKNVIDSGELGEILFVKMEHNQCVVRPEGSWLKSIDALGGGGIMSCLCHQIDALRWYCGEVEKVNCMHKTIPSRMEGECIGTICTTMASGALALLNINWYTQSFSFKGPIPNGLWYELTHITGTKGDAYYMRDRGTFFKKNSSYASKESTSEFGGAGNVSGPGEFVKIDAPQALKGHIVLVEEFVKAALGQQANILTYGADCVKTVEVAEAAYIAAATERTVTLPIIPTPWEKRNYLIK